MLELTLDLVQINKLVLSSIELHLCGFNNEFISESNLYLLLLICKFCLAGLQLLNPADSKHNLILEKSI